MARVLIVDDAPAIADLLRDYLDAEGFAVVIAPEGNAALQAVAAQEFDCVVLDVMMPGISGFEVCRAIRARSIVPILFLSAKDTDIDKIRGLGLGADDYISKSATPPEVVSRVKALVRRYRAYLPIAESGAAPAPLDFGYFVLDPAARTLAVEGVPVHLTAREFDVLLFFAQHPGQVFSREHLFDRIWGDFGDLHTVTVHIAKLREKIEPDPSAPTFIKTVRGVGYRFDRGA